MNTPSESRGWTTPRKLLVAAAVVMMALVVAKQFFTKADWTAAPILAVLMMVVGTTVRDARRDGMRPNSVH